MSKLRPAQLGPIVGHATSTSARIWIRGSAGDEGPDIDGECRTIGVIAITWENGRRPRRRRVYYFRLRREYDRTGTFTLGEELGLKAVDSAPLPLLPDTGYVVRVGTLLLDDPSPEDDSLSHGELAKRLPAAEVWFDDLEALPAEESEARFRTFPAEDGSVGRLSFIVGSCRYPGLLWKTKQSDAIFEPLLREAMGQDGRDAVRLLLMVGDQIYADMLNRHVPLGLADTFEEFQQRYHAAFGSRHMRRLLRQLPAYMILDDHEIEDNWCQDRVRRAESRRVFNLAISAYRSYQWVHGPGGYGQRLFYRFNCGRYPFFAMDSRTQRYMDDVPDCLDDNHLLGRPSLAGEEPSQLDLLLAWLGECQQKLGDTPKFIVSPSVFAPNPMDARSGRPGSATDRARRCEASDSWPAFPATRASLLRHIVESRVQNVVFLSGDIHCSNVAELLFRGSDAASKLRAFSITSSAFYWPFPFADGDPSGFVHDSQAQGQEDGFDFSADSKPHTMDYLAWNFTQEDNFCRVDIDPETAKLTVTAFGSQGQVLESGGWFGQSGKPLRAELALAPWTET
ncbi:phosphodiesterase [Chromobacterium phragmitis]|uniref:alkaline phosphatase D family protein n=1 Tax=Chromobacterium phragmitis TaxID=2202141 RepID=UPI000DECAB16|nr:alkaline phosphatase D family protein [Chromobacterium phragmitis]AXE28900.1 phosphodiesterase [Chromobacterium phragmitis]